MADNTVAHKNPWMEKFIFIQLNWANRLMVSIHETSNNRDSTSRIDRWELETIGL